MKKQSIEKFVEDIKRNKESQTRRGLGLISLHFWKKTAISSQILHLVENKNKEISDPELSSLIESEAQKNLIINICTAVEVFLKDFVKKYCDDHSEQVMSRSLFSDKTISITQAVELFSKEPPTLGDVFSASVKFGSLGEIEKNLTEITGKKFLEEIGKTIVVLETESEKEWFKKSKVLLDVDTPKWKSILEDMFEKRHEFVHQVNVDGEFKALGVRELIAVLSIFVAAIEKKFNV